MSIHEMPFGPRFTDKGVEFRFWAPKAARVEILLQDPGRTGGDFTASGMSKSGKGWFELHVDDVRPDWRYGFRIDGALTVPDPASRYQQDGVHGPSTLIDPSAYKWVHEGWTGLPWHEAVIYELHVGTFTTDGTFDGVRDKLDYLAGLGVTAIQLMPIGAFSGMRNWGYDGVLPYAPSASYGRPETLKRLIDEAHGRGMMVFLDVIYNHFGPDGNYLHVYAPEFFNRKFHTPWGPAINFGREEVRDFVRNNVLYWLEEFRFDGLRFDAVHAIVDKSERHILEEIGAAVRERFADRRRVHMILENVENTARYLERENGGVPVFYTAQWNDDIHHALHVLLTGETDGYYGDYAERPSGHLGRCLAEGFAYQGEPSPHLGGRPRGEKSGQLSPTAFVSFLQNHDQVGNRAFGERIGQLAPAPAVRAATAIVLLAPHTPMLFMGEEWGADEPFLFFCDFHDELGAAVRDGRRNEFRQFTSFEQGGAEDMIPDPNDLATFEASVLDWQKQRTAPFQANLEANRQLLEIRRNEIVPLLTSIRGHGGQYQVLSDTAVVVEWAAGDEGTLRMIINLASGPAETDGLPTHGRLIYATHDTAVDDLAAGRLKPWFVAVFIG